MTPKKKRAFPSPIMVLGLPLLLFGIVRVLWTVDPTDASAQAPPIAPRLFDEDEARPAGRIPGCAHRGEDLASEADLRRMRYPYAPQDGVAAVRLYRQSEWCFETAGNQGYARRVAEARRQLSERMESEYRLHRVRLGRAMANRDTVRALAAAQSLQRILAHQDNDYVRWLNRLVRDFELMGDE